MSMIHQLFPATSADMSGLCDFLNANKSGTFLNDCTITREVISTGLEGLYITQEDPNNPGYYNKISIFTYYGGSNHRTGQYEYLDSEQTVIRTWVTPDASNNQNRRIRELMFCDNGFMLTMHVGTNATAFCNIVIITIDSNGNLILMIPSSSTMPTQTGLPTIGYHIVSNTTVTSQALTPAAIIYGTNRTCLAPIAVPFSEDPTAYLPYAWVASQTQLSALSNPAFTGVRINNEDYITNGMIYIKDSNE